MRDVVREGVVEKSRLGWIRKRELEERREVGKKREVEIK